MAPGYPTGRARRRSAGPLNEDRGPWPPVIWRPRRPDRVHRAPLNEDRGPWPPVMAAAPRRGRLGPSLNEDRGPWPPVISSTPSIPANGSIAQRRPGAMAPGYELRRRPQMKQSDPAQRRPGAMAPGYRDAIPGPHHFGARSTKTGGHGPRLFAALCHHASSHHPAQRRPGAMAPGYTRQSGAGRVRCSPLNEDRGPWPPVMWP